jgi:hypothetical protein
MLFLLCSGDGELSAKFLGKSLRDCGQGSGRTRVEVRGFPLIAKGCDLLGTARVTVMSGPAAAVFQKWSEIRKNDRLRFVIPTLSTIKLWKGWGTQL